MKSVPPSTWRRVIALAAVALSAAAAAAHLGVTEVGDSQEPAVAHTESVVTPPGGDLSRHSIDADANANADADADANANATSTSDTSRQAQPLQALARQERGPEHRAVIVVGDAQAAVRGAAVTAARAQLERARRELDAGREPLPGERLHGAEGDSRLSPAYFLRQARLEEAVSHAQARLDAAEWAVAEQR
jgi:hypothetical protein